MGTIEEMMQEERANAFEKMECHWIKQCHDAGWSFSKFKKYCAKHTGLRNEDDEYWIDCFKQFGFTISSYCMDIDEFIKFHFRK